MGKKYASMHIITNQQDVIVTRLLEYYKQNLNYDEKALNAAKIVGNVELVRFALRVKELSLNHVLILLLPDLISVYDADLSFETIEQSARDISEIIKTPIVYISNFDDDVLLFGLICSGDIITSGIIGDGLSIYGLDHIDIDVQKFKTDAGIGDDPFCKAIDDSNDIETVEKEFIRILGVPLKLTEEMITEKNEYVQIKKQEGVLIIKNSSEICTKEMINVKERRIYFE